MKHFGFPGRGGRSPEAPSWANRLSRILLTVISMMASQTTVPAHSQPWNGPPVERPLPPLHQEGHVERDGARIWYATLGAGAPVILLHGGMASSSSWGNQVPALVRSHHRVILIDSRGHGRSTLGTKPLSYELMEGDVLAVMDALGIEKTAIVGWSDGANTGLVMAMRHPKRLGKLYAFGANMNLQAIKPDAFSAPILGQVVKRLALDYQRLSPTPKEFRTLHEAVEAMQNVKSNYSTDQLQSINGPDVMIADGDRDEFIKPDHPAYLSAAIPGSQLTILKDAGHFAPWQRVDTFNNSMIGFLGKKTR
jgi:pimeloyl-ACP methyl ester carboxylesterase